MVMLGGVCLFIAAALVTRVDDRGDRPVDEAAMIDADAHEPLGIQGSAQPVPSSGA